MNSAQGQGDLRRQGENDELLEAYAHKHLSAVLAQKRQTRFSGDVAIKFEFQRGLLRQLHTDDHNVITGEMLRRLP